MQNDLNAGNLQTPLPRRSAAALPKRIAAAFTGLPVPQDRNDEPRARSAMCRWAKCRSSEIRPDALLIWVREVIRRLEADGWRLVATDAGPRYRQRRPR